MGWLGCMVRLRNVKRQHKRRSRTRREQEGMVASWEGGGMEWACWTCGRGGSTGEPRKKKKADRDSRGKREDKLSRVIPT